MADKKISQLARPHDVAYNDIFVGSQLNTSGQYETGAIYAGDLAYYVMQNITAGDGITLSLTGYSYTGDHNHVSSPTLTVSSTLNTEIFCVLNGKGDLADQTDHNKIYLVPESDTTEEGDSGDHFSEYIWADSIGKWEKIGYCGPSIDVSGFATKDELEDYAKSDVLKNYLLKSEIDTVISEREIITKSDLDKALEEADITDKLSDYVTYTFLSEQSYLTAGDIAEVISNNNIVTEDKLKTYSLVTFTDVANEPKVTIKVVTGDSTSQKDVITSLDGYATEKWTEERIAQILSGDGDFSLESLVSKEELSNCGYITNAVLGSSFDTTNTVKKYVDDEIGKIPSVSLADKGTDKVTITVGSVSKDVLTSVDLSDIDTKFDKGEGELTYNTAYALENALSLAIAKIEALEAKLAYYDARFGYPATGTPSDDNDWTVNFLRID